MARTPKRRKPRRKRLIVNATQSSDIPYSKCRIEWIDIVSDSGWADEKAFNKMKVATPVNEGWVYSKDKDKVKVFASYDKDDDGTLTFGDRTVIPTSCIKKIIKLNQVVISEGEYNKKHHKYRLIEEGGYMAKKKKKKAKKKKSKAKKKKKR